MTGESGIVVTMFKAVVGTFTGRYPDHESGTDEKWVPCEKKCKRKEVRILY